MLRQTFTAPASQGDVEQRDDGPVVAGPDVAKRLVSARNGERMQGANTTNSTATAEPIEFERERMSALEQHTVCPARSTGLREEDIVGRGYC